METFRAELPDPLIEDAVRRLPEPYYELVGASLETALKARRDALAGIRHSLLRTDHPQVEIQATDEDEYVHAEHLPSGDLVVRVGLDGDADEDPAPPWFERTFRHDETGRSGSTCGAAATARRSRARKTDCRAHRRRRRG